MAMTQDDIAKANVQQKYLQATAGGALGTGTLAPSWLAGWAGWLAGWLESPRKGQAAALTETFAPIGWLAGLAGSGLADLGGFLPSKVQRTSCCPF